MIALEPTPIQCADTGQKVVLDAERDCSRVRLTCPACGQTWLTNSFTMPDGWRYA